MMEEGKIKTAKWTTESNRQTDADKQSDRRRHTDGKTDRQTDADKQSDRRQTDADKQTDRRRNTDRRKHRQTDRRFVFT